MPEPRWWAFIESLDRLGGHDKAVMERLIAALAKGTVESRACIDMPTGPGRQIQGQPAGVLGVSVKAIIVGIPPEDWREVCLAPLMIDGQPAGWLLRFPRAPWPWYRITLLRRDVEILVDARSQGGRPKRAETERMTNWVQDRPLADRLPKHGRGTELWEDYKKLRKEETGAEPELSDNYAVDVINKTLAANVNVVAFPQPDK